MNYEEIFTDLIYEASCKAEKSLKQEELEELANYINEVLSNNVANSKAKELIEKAVSCSGDITCEIKQEGDRLNFSFVVKDYLLKETDYEIEKDENYKLEECSSLITDLASEDSLNLEGILSLVLEERKIPFEKLVFENSKKTTRENYERLDNAYAACQADIYDYDYYD